MINKDTAEHCLYRGERELAGKRVGVLGLARTGVACVEFLTARKARVVALDAQPMERLPEPTRQALVSAECVLAPHGSLAEAMPLDMLVLSPGVPSQSPLVQEARSAGVEVIGEVELAYRFCDAPMVAVTGTCGKGTTVTALGAMLQAAGITHVVAGNIGTPLVSEMNRSRELQVVVAEISSFQLETTVHFHPYIAVLLNITEDHLERYDSFQAYVEAKALLFRNQTAADYAIICMDDPVARTLAGRTTATILTIARNDPTANGRVEDGALVVQLPDSPPEQVAFERELPLPGAHHTTNFLAAALAARLCGAPASALAPALRNYRPAAHLMTLVAELDGVRYVDDSKATNPASAVADLSGIEGPVIVIAGGKEKNTDFNEFGRVLRERAKRVVLVGECAERIRQAVDSPDRCVDAASMEEAVRLAREVATPGDTVILCPGCSSLDMFANYADRGEAFAQAVLRQLADANTKR